jgi:O-antigen ligase
MTIDKPFFAQAGQWLAFAAAASIAVSIAAFQILLGLSLLALLLSGEPIRFPRFKWLLVAFFAITVIAWLHSGDLKLGLPQIKKFYVWFGTPLVVFSLLRSATLIRRLFLLWAALASFTGIVGFIQFIEKVESARAAGVAFRNFYNYYVGSRITGFTSHWNTFSAEEMFALLMLLAILFFGAKLERLWIWLVCCGLMGFAVLLIETRGVYIALAAGVIFLVWFWRKTLLIALPVLALIGYFAAPTAIRERFQSVRNPNNLDSNEFRVIVWRTGIQMIEAHPLLGVGPEEQRVHFDDYIPPELKEIKKTTPGFYGHAHNVYIEFAAERGIPCLLVFLAMIGMMIRDFARGLRGLAPGPGMRRVLILGAMASILAALVEGFVEVNLGDSEVLTMFLVVVTCAYLALEKDLVFD